MPIESIKWLALLLVVCYAIFGFISGYRGYKPLPGPPGYPIIGNLLQFPRLYPWTQLKRWADQYGPVYQLQVLGTTYVVLGTVKAANDLLRARGSLYSDRHYIAVLRNQIHLPTIGYGATWRRQRRFFHAAQLTCTSSSPVYTRVLENHLVRLLRELATSPQSWPCVFDGYVCGIVTELAYGKRITSSWDPYVSKVLRLYKEFEQAAGPGHYLVNMLPWLRFVPRWIAKFKDHGREYLEWERKHLLDMHESVRKQFVAAAEKDMPNSVSRMYWEMKENGKVSGTDDVEAAYTIGAFVEASMAGTPATLKIFVLAMMHYPEWQLRLQQEVDEVCWGARMPVLADSPRLPVVRAVLKEMIRWRPALPGGFPHRLMEDDTYEGYHLRKGSVVMWHHWTMSRDSTMFPDPEVFNPARYLDPAFPAFRAPLTKYPTLQFDPGFGFGRRMCPGTQQAEDMMLLAVAGMVLKYEFRRKSLEDGSQVKVPWYEYVGGNPTRPVDFEFELVQRHVANEGDVV